MFTLFSYKQRYILVLIVDRNLAVSSFAEMKIATCLKMLFEKVPVCPTIKNPANLRTVKY
jgi:hypothetical protein